MIPRLLASIALLAAGCGPGFARLELEERHGECAGYCVRSTTVTASGDATITRSTRDGEATPLVRTAALSRDERRAVEAAAERAEAEAWEARYGCPDCADQGAWTLRLTAPGEVRESLLDPEQLPEHLAPLADELHRIADAYGPAKP